MGLRTGEREPLSGIDAAWLHMDRPMNTADVVAVMTFRRRMPLAAVRRLVEEKLLRHPRFRQRVVRDGRALRAAWEDDPSFSLRRHVVRAGIPRGGTAALQRFASGVATDPLDGGHPLWRIHVVDGAGAGSAIVAKLHHCLADGFALVGVLLSLADESAHPGAEEQPSPPGELPHRLPTYRDLRPEAPIAELVRGALADPRRAAELAGRGAEFLRSLGRMALLPPDPRTCLARALTGTRRVAFSRPLPLADLRERARRLGATVNELLIAAVAGALREVLVAAGDAPVDVRALVPVNLRDRLPDAGTPLGNRFGLVFLQLPVGAADAAERLALVRARTAELKRSADAVVTWAVLAAVGHLAALEQLVIEFFARKASLVVTSVPGPRAPLHLAGREIGQIMFNVPHPATLGLGVSLLSYAGGVTIGARADAAPLPDPGALVRGIARAAETLR